MKISVVVVTRNRIRDCNETVESLLKQTVQPEEIIVVDSGSLAPFVYDHPKVKVIRTSSEIGLSLSRNLGVRASKGDVVAFIDDDAIADEDWVKGISNSIQNADIVGGPVKPLYLSTRPKWTNDPRLTTTVLGITRCSQDVIGCNMAVRREVFQRIGYFNSSLGRIRGKLLSGEEGDFFRRAQRCGMRNEFTKLMKVSHKVFPYRLTFRYLLNRLIWEGVTTYLVLCEERGKFNVLARVLPAIIADSLRVMIFGGRRFPAWIIAIRLGQLYGISAANTSSKIEREPPLESLEGKSVKL
jgi:glycosyltransferase involved in cell wall biosynthesis